MAVLHQNSIELKAFLSHRYKSPEINLFFFKLFANEANVHFEVDIGTLATNVTRLERMIKSVDAFIGLYPLPFAANETVKHSDLLSSSRYFRLELDIAIRAQKPILVFFDQRYGEVLNLPEKVLCVPFDIQEIVGKGGAPNKLRYQRIIANFFRYVKTIMLAKAESPITSPKLNVGLIVPTGKGGLTKYSDKEIQVIKRVTRENNILELHTPPKPWILNGQMYRWLESLDWVIVDIGETSMRNGITGFLHGFFIPTVRLYKGKSSITQVENKASYSYLFSGTDAGYRKDIVFWNSSTELRNGLKKRLESLLSPTLRISTWEESEEYFLKASKRNEAVFLSYSGKDQEIARQISNLLKRRFQEVFDYRDGKSITPGQPWIDEIFEQLAKSAVGVPILSEDYFKSGYCLHEAEEMVSYQDAGQMTVIPIKMNPAQLNMPAWMQNTQYLRLYEHKSYEDVVEKIVESLDDSKVKK
jgi:TIR domain.